MQETLADPIALDPTHTHLRHPKAIEYFFILYTFGFIVDEYAAVKEHGLSVYLASVGNGAVNMSDAAGVELL